MESKIEKVSEYKGYKYIVIGQPAGHRCGYIQIPKNNRLYEKTYNEINRYLPIHGEWTWSEFGKDYPIKTESNEYYIGFHCMYDSDGIDFELIKELNSSISYNPTTYKRCNLEPRTTEYVENELKKAIDFIINLESKEEK